MSLMIKMVRLLCDQSQEKKFMGFYPDSLSTLQALGELKTDHPLLMQTKQELVFMRVSGHVGIRGNEAADLAAKEALDKNKNENGR